jgi:prepilin-type N-terminal cleavage/methylation domain-containing protein
VADHRTVCARGFTLVEILMSMALMAFIMVAAALAIQSAEMSHNYCAEKAELGARGRGVLDRIALDVRQAASVRINEEGELEVTVAEGWIHTYAWDGTPGGNVTYTETNAAGVEFPQVLLAGFTQAFDLEGAGEGCRIHLRLEGRRATFETTITATPGKVLW